jgi:hypothetical protein
MTLPTPIERLWSDLEAARAEVLREVDGLSQSQADWKPSEKDWSVGEIVDHLTVAEIATGKLTTKLTREAEAAGTLAPFPADLAGFPPFPDISGEATEAPAVVWPAHGKSMRDLLATMKATRERSRSSIEKLATLDPRPLVFKHFRFGELTLAQWWQLQTRHDLLHLQQLRDVKAAPGFPKA